MNYSQGDILTAEKFGYSTAKEAVGNWQPSNGSVKLGISYDRESGHVNPKGA